MLKEDKKMKLIDSLKTMHNSSLSLTESYWREERRKVYITPSMFLEFIENLKKIYDLTKNKIEKKTT